MLRSTTSFASQDGWLAGAQRLPRAQSRPYLDGLVIMLLPSIVNLPAVPPFSRSMVSFLFIALLLKNIFLYSAISHAWSRKVGQSFKETFNARNRALFLFMVILLLFTISEIRAGYLGLSNPLGYGGFFLWAFSVILYLLSVVALNRSHEARRMLIIAFVCGLGFFVIINILSYLAGLRGSATFDEIGQNKMLSLVGVHAQRVWLPFTSGTNNFGAMAGMVVVSGFSIIRATRGSLLLFVGTFVVIIGIIGCVVVDSRGPLAVSIVVGLIICLLTSRFSIRRIVSFLPLLVLVSPFIVIGIGIAIQESGVAGLFLREGAFAQRLGVLTGRNVVWASAADILSDPSPSHLIGYGMLGQVTSGAAKGYSWIFADSSGMTSHTLHNTNLQLIFDIGYIGLGLWVYFWMLLMKNLMCHVSRARHDITVAVPLAIACFVLLSGIIETAGTPSYPDVFVLVMFIMAWSLPAFSDTQPMGGRGEPNVAGIVAASHGQTVRSSGAILPSIDGYFQDGRE